MQAPATASSATRSAHPALRPVGPTGPPGPARQPLWGPAGQEVRGKKRGQLLSPPSRRREPHADPAESSWGQPRVAYPQGGKAPSPMGPDVQFSLPNAHRASTESVPGPVWALGLWGQSSTWARTQGALARNHHTGWPTQASIDGRTQKRTVSPHNGTPLSLRKGAQTPATTGMKLADITSHGMSPLPRTTYRVMPFTRNVQKKRILRQKADQCLPGAGGGGSEEPLLTGMRLLF